VDGDGPVAANVDFRREMLNLRVVSLLALLAAASPSAAQQGGYQEADAELNRLYQKIESRLADSHDVRRELIAAQRAWIAFRDAECRFAASGVEGGSAYPQVYQACQEDLTRARIADFNGYLGCEEGDLSCPVPAE
jgi:uncharacterized protein YecT (DUF1311 family)